MKINVVNDDFKNVKSNALVIGLYEGEKKLSGEKAIIDKDLGGLISKFVLKQDKFDAKFKSIYILQTYGKINSDKILIVGLGKKGDLSLAKISELATKIAKKVKSFNMKKISVILNEK